MRSIRVSPPLLGSHSPTRSCVALSDAAARPRPPRTGLGAARSATLLAAVLAAFVAGGPDTEPVVASVASRSPDALHTSPASVDDVQATLRVCKSGCEHAKVQDAIDAAEAGDTILVGSGIYPENLAAWRSVRIRGVAAENTVFDGGGEGPVLYVPDGVQVTLSDVAITNGVGETGGGIVNLGALTLREVRIAGNRAVGPDVGQGPTEGYGGGIYNYEGSITMRDSVVEDNEATFGGGIYSLGTSVIEDSEVRGNRASSGGAGIFNFDGTLLVHNARVGDNRVTGQGPGGGIYNFSVVAVSYSLLDGNQASDFGGAIYQRKGGTYISASTLSGNTAGFGGGGLYLLRGEGVVASATVVRNGGSFGGGFNVQEDAELELINTIVADSPGSNCFGEIDSFGYNLDSGNTCGFDDEDDQFNIDPEIEDLADNGGVTFTHALSATSPAVDRGDFAGCTDFNGYDVGTDQRGRNRHVDGDGDSEVRCDIGAFEYDPAGSGPPPPPDPVACTGITACSGDCDHATIAAAIAAAAPGATVCAREGVFDERVVIDKPITLQGAGPALSTIDAGGKGPALAVTGDVAVTVAQIALVNGAGVINVEGDLTLRDCRVSGHSAPEDGSPEGPQGSGVVNGGTLLVERCAVYDNLSFGSGGGIDTRIGRATVRDSVFEDNTAANRGGGIASDNAMLTVSGSTFTNNESQTGGAISAVGNMSSEADAFTGNFARFGGAIYAEAGAEVSQGVFQRNQADLGGAIYAAGTLTSSGSRLFDNIATGEFGYGGGVYTSEAEATIGGGFINDNYAWNGGAVSAQGAVSIEGVTLSGNRARYGGAIIQFDGLTTVRGGIINANVSDFAGGAGYLANGELRLVDGVQVRDNTSLADAGAMLITADTTLTVDGADLINNTAEVAGGVLNRGTFHATRARINNHGASGGLAEETEDPDEEPVERPGRGGALLNDEGGSARIVSSLLAGNGAELGGAVWNAGTLEMLNSTLSANGADVGGGALYNFGGQATLRNITAAFNTTDAEAEGGGVVRNTEGGTVRVGHSVFAESEGVANCAGPVTSLGYNVVDGASCAFGGAGDQMDTDPMLAELADIGGRTEAHDLLTDSPVIDAGDPTGCRDLADAPLTVDQRNVTRPADGDDDGSSVCDPGAIEHSAAAPQPTPGPGGPEGAIFLPWGSR